MKYTVVGIAKGAEPYRFTIVIRSAKSPNDAEVKAQKMYHDDLVEAGGGGEYYHFPLTIAAVFKGEPRVAQGMNEWAGWEEDFMSQAGELDLEELSAVSLRFLQEEE